TIDFTGTRFLYDSSASDTVYQSLEVGGVIKTGCVNDVYVALSGGSAPAPPPPSPILSLSATALSFSAIQGGTNPASQIVQVSNSGGGMLAWTATSSPSWLSVSPTSGSGSASISVSVNVGGLLAGNLSGTITFTATGAQGSPKSVPVNLGISLPP